MNHPLVLRKVWIRLWFICLATASTSARAWENDVHYGLTQWLARMVGFSEEQATWIAFGNQGVDDSTVTGPVISTTLSSCVKTDAAGAATVAKNHFPSRVLPPSDAGLRLVAKGEPWWDTNLALVPKVDESAATFLALGRYLHSLQDSWSHQGKPDIPYSCNAQYAWGHSLARGGWSCHLADLTYKWVDSDAVPMAKATYDLFAQVYRRKPTNTWDNLRQQVVEFSRLDNKIGKRNWFGERQFKNHDDIAYATSLKNCPDRQSGCYFDVAFEVARRYWDSRQQTIPPLSEGLPKELLNLLTKVGDAMTRGDEKTLRSLVDRELAQVALSRALRINTSCADLYEEQFKWSFLDSFLAAKGAHQPVSMCELAMKIQADEKPGLTCSVATQEAMKAYREAQARGPDLRAMISKLGPALKRLFVFSNVRKARDNGEGADYWALGYFPHLPQDRLLLGVSKKGEMYKVTAFVWQPDE